MDGSVACSDTEIQGLGLRVYDLGLRVSGFRVYGLALGFRVYHLGFRVYDLGLRVKKLAKGLRLGCWYVGFRVEILAEASGPQCF